MSVLLEPFNYAYMTNAIWVSALVGAICGLFSVYLMLKGWSLIGDALSHSVVPGVAAAYMLAFPLAVGAFFTGLLAALSMLFLSDRSGLKTDVIIGMIYTSFFGVGLLMISVSPIPIDVQSIAFGNILGIAPSLIIQLVAIGVIVLAAFAILWRPLLAVFFDENHAQSIGINVGGYKVIFFALLAATIVAAMQTVGALLVVAMVITPGATAYLLSDRFGILLLIAGAIGVLSGAMGAYASYFLNGATGGIIVLFQTIIFVAAFVFAPKYGIIASARRRKNDINKGA